MAMSRDPRVLLLREPVERRHRAQRGNNLRHRCGSRRGADHNLLLWLIELLSSRFEKG